MKVNKLKEYSVKLTEDEFNISSQYVFASVQDLSLYKIPIYI